MSLSSASPSPAPGAVIVDTPWLQHIVVDLVQFGTGAVMQDTGIVTTGLTPMTIGSYKTFELLAVLDHLPWNLAGGQATLKMTDPNGVSYSYAATISASGWSAAANWTVLAPAGVWHRAWDVTDASGNRQVSLPIVFDVISSPT